VRPNKMNMVSEKTDWKNNTNGGIWRKRREMETKKKARFRITFVIPLA